MNNLIIIKLDNDEVFEERYKEALEKAKQIGKVNLLIFYGKGITMKSSEIQKQYSAEFKEYCEKSAVVGLEGLKRALLSSIIIATQRKIKVFDTEEEARVWLAE